MCDRTTENVCFTSIVTADSALNVPTAADAAAVGSVVNYAITGTKSGSADTTIFSVMLYAETGGWDNFLAAVDRTSSTDVEYEENYSGYAMFWYCDLRGTVDATVAGSGCCLRDRESTDGGGYCIIYDATDPLNPTVDTYWMVESEFNTAVTASDYTLPASKKVTQTTTNKGFTTFKCSMVAQSDGAELSCYKLQLWPAAAYSGGFRFEKGNRVEAYMYDFAQPTFVNRWRANRTFFLEGATTLLALTSVMTTAALMAF